MSSSKKNTTRKNRKEEVVDNHKITEEEDIIEIKLQENDISMNPLLEKKFDLFQYSKKTEKKIKNLEPPDAYICLNSHTNVEIDGILVNIYIGKEKDENTYQLQMIAKGSDIKSEDTERDDRDIPLYSSNGFNTVLSILEDIEEVKNSYKLMEHELMSPRKMERIKLQRKIYPLSSNYNCSVCYEPTVEYSICKHPICFRCRYTCIRSDNLVCPICRKGDLKLFPTELAGEDEYFITY